MGIYKFDGDIACSSDSHGGIYSHLCDFIYLDDQFGSTDYVGLLTN